MTPVLVRGTALAAALQLFSAGASAMTEKEAASNLMHFAFAQKGGEQCDKLGYPSMAALRRWEQQQGDLLARSMQQIEKFAQASGKVGAADAHDVALGLFVRMKDGYDQEMAPGVTGKSCLRFNETLAFYGTRLVRD